jgi:hypothetical protein
MDEILGVSTDEWLLANASCFAVNSACAMLGLDQMMVRKVDTILKKKNTSELILTEVFYEAGLSVLTVLIF